MIPTPLTDAQHATTIYGAPKSQAFVKYERDSYEAMLVLARELERKLTEKDKRIAELEQRDKDWKSKYESTMETWAANGVRRDTDEAAMKQKCKVLGAICDGRLARIAELEKIVVNQ